MRKYFFIFLIFLTFSYSFPMQIELKMPVFDKANGILKIYTYEHETKNEITVVFLDEDHPNPFVDFIYDVYRFFKWGRFYDIETFYVSDNTVIFEDDFCDSKSYFQVKNLHNQKEIPFDDFEKEDDRIVIYVSTWNHMFSNKPLPNTEYITYKPENLNGTRNDVESIYSWKKNIRLKFTFYLFLVVIILGSLTIFLN